MSTDLETELLQEAERAEIRAQETDERTAGVRWKYLRGIHEAEAAHLRQRAALVRDWEQRSYMRSGFDTYRALTGPIPSPPTCKQSLQVDPGTGGGATVCRRCSECQGEHHHAIDNPDAFQEEDPTHECKHCDALGDECETCDGDGERFSDDGDNLGLCPACEGHGVIWRAPAVPAAEPGKPATCICAKLSVDHIIPPPRKGHFIDCTAHPAHEEWARVHAGRATPEKGGTR